MSVREWAEFCHREEHRAPTMEEAQGGRRHAPLPTSSRHRTRQSKPADAPPTHPFEDDGDAVMTDILPTDMVDPAASLPTPPPTVLIDSEQPSDGALNKRSNADRIKAREAKEALDNEFLKSFAPHTMWLPRGLKPEDYTPEFCRTLEKIYWRRCGMGKPWYGADMKGASPLHNRSLIHRRQARCLPMRLHRGTSPRCHLNSPAFLATIPRYLGSIRRTCTSVCGELLLPGTSKTWISSPLTTSILAPPNSRIHFLFFKNTFDAFAVGMQFHKASPTLWRIS